MALHYDLSAIDGYKDLCLYETGNKDKDGAALVKTKPVTEALIFHMMAIHIGGSITAKNVKEVFSRIYVREQIVGALVATTAGPRPITVEDVCAHIGLSTNAYTNNKTKFKNDLLYWSLRDAGTEFERQDKALKDKDGARQLADIAANAAAN